MLTYADLISDLRDFLRTNTSEDAGRDIRRAIRDAWAEFPSLHTWSYFWCIGRLNLEAPYSTGTIAYDQTGGSSERMVTLSDGTWPSYAAQCVLQIGQQVYRVATKVSSTVITLDSVLNPGADLAAGTTYSLQMEAVNLPADFRQGDQLLLPTQLQRIRYVTPSNWQSRSRIVRYGSWPNTYTVLPSPNMPDRFAAMFEPYPSAGMSIEMLYQRTPRRPRVEEISTGLASCSANSTTITFTDSSLGLTADQHNGCILRFSADNVSKPTAVEGNIEGNNPYAVELVIKDASAYAGAFTVEVFAAPTVTLGTKMFTISDPIDFGTDAVQIAFIRRCESMLALWRNMKEQAAISSNRADSALLRAKESDQKIVDLWKMLGMSPWRMLRTSSMEIVP